MPIWKVLPWLVPTVSGVAALGLSYAVKERRHFKAAEFIELMKETANDQFYNSTMKKGKNCIITITQLLVLLQL